MLLNDGMLILKGWLEDERTLRVCVVSDKSRIVATCTIYKIEEAHIAFHISESDYFEFSLAGCELNFGDAKESAKEMPIGLMAESAIKASRAGFEALIVLLEAESV
jgi:hypothetical protein